MSCDSLSDLWYAYMYVCNVLCLVLTAAKINFTSKILVLVYPNSTYTHYKNYSFDLIFVILI